MSVGAALNLGRKAGRLVRGFVFCLRVKAAGGSAGWGMQLERGVLLRWGAHRGLQFGPRVYIGRGVVLDVPPGGLLSVGARSKIMHYSVIAAAERVTIGAASQVAEHCSIRDSDHGLSRAQLMLDQSISTPVSIGRDVWVASGVRVLRGSVISDGCVIGANAVAKGHFPEFAIIVGVPGRVVRTRDAS